MAVTTDKILKVVVSILLGDDTVAQMIYHFLTEFAGTQTDADVLDALELWVEALYDAIAGQVSDTVTMDTMEVDVVEWDSEEEEFLTIQNVGERTPTVPFTSIAEMLPNQMAATMGAYTFNPKVRGRKSFPGIGEDSAVEGELDNDALVALGLALVEYLTDIEITAGNDMLTGVASKSQEGFRAFGSGWINDIMGTQRRRKRGVGA